MNTDSTVFALSLNGRKAGLLLIFLPALPLKLLIRKTKLLILA